MVKDDRYASDNPHDRDAIEPLDGVAGVSTVDETEESTADVEESTDASIESTPWSTITAPIDGFQPTDASNADNLADVKPSTLARPLIAAPEALLSPPPVSNEAVTFPVNEVETIEAGLSDDEAASVAAALAQGEDDEIIADVSSDTEDEDADEDDDVLEEASALAAGIATGGAAASMQKFTLSTPGGWWTIPTLCAGLAIIACGVIIPQTDANRRLAHEKAQLQLDYDSITRQVEVNELFLSHVANDPNLAERLAQRQAGLYRENTAVLPVGNANTAHRGAMSPFQLTAVIPPEPLPPYQPRSGFLANTFLHPKHGLWACGVGLFLAATGLVMGGGTRVAVKEEEVPAV